MVIGCSRMWPAARVIAVAVMLAFGLAVPGRARADTPRSEPARGAVALLPLDAGPRLEIYGQAVATEIARALTAGGVEVVVVGANMDVPAAARLIVDGTLAAEKGLVSLSMRVRNPVDGTVLDTLAASAPGLAQIDRAAADLSARVVPVVRTRLAALAERPSGERPGGERPGGERPGGERPGAGAARRSLLLAVSAGAPATGDPLRAALAGAAEPWARAAGRTVQVVEAASLAGALAPKAVGTANAERAISFEVLRYTVVARGDVPLARARVRVRISDANTTLFDRVILTDTIVGERRMQPVAVAARAAAEVLSILRPHLRRILERWP